MAAEPRDGEWPHKELGKELSNWGRWGEDDEIGTLNFVTPEKRVQAARSVRTGKIFNLGMPFDKKGPFATSMFRDNPIHRMTIMPSDTAGSPDGVISSDDMVIMGTQSATQWDSLAHVGYDGFFYNGMPQSAINSFQGATRNSFPKANSRLISRGVLLDIARLKGVDALEIGYEITPEDLDAAEERQGVTVESGDILAIRTGAYQWFLAGDIEKYMHDEPGPGLACCRWFHDREVAAVAVDNHAVEVRPSPAGSSLAVHMVAIRDMGLMLGEMFDFEELAADCEEDGVWDFLFSAAGLDITGAVASPLTPMALK